MNERELVILRCTRAGGNLVAKQGVDKGAAPSLFAKAEEENQISRERHVELIVIQDETGKRGTFFLSGRLGMGFKIGGIYEMQIREQITGEGQ